MSSKIFVGMDVHKDSIDITVAEQGPEQYDAFLKTEIAKWARVVKEANIKVEQRFRRPFRNPEIPL